MITIFNIFDAVVGVCLVYPMDREKSFAEAKKMCQQRFNYTLTRETFLEKWKESKEFR